MWKECEQGANTLNQQLWDVCSDQEAVDLVRDVQDPSEGSKILVEHALSRFSTDNLSCMIVRLDKEALAQSQTRQDAEPEANNGAAAKVSEVDKIIMDTKQKIAEGTTPAVGVSASNSGRGYDTAPPQEEGFVPTSLGDALVEEPVSIEEADSPELATGESPAVAAPESKLEAKVPADA